MAKMHVLTAALLGLYLAACSSIPYGQRLQVRQQQYNAAAGASVQGFRLILGNIYSWEPLSDTQLVVYTLPTRAYLLDVWPCSNLTFTNGIGLTSFAGQVQTGFDKVMVGRGFMPCMIKQIRPVNLAQLKMEKATLRHVDSLPRESAGQAPSPAGKD
ncbi:hypothetical protein ISP15_07140 [Dyella jejuensis]|uniref:Uncharacterized protein n=1 Tax=Dyella jejuensis TaxID=1432009 RepID=A0ABW8JGC2_9GAMM